MARGVTGVLLFIPISFWVIYVCLKSGVLNAKQVAVSYAGGIAGHILLGLTYMVFKLTGSATIMLAADIAVVCLPFLVAGMGSRFLGTGAIRGAVPASV